MKKFLSLLLCLIMCLSFTACEKFSDEKAALTQHTWFSAKETSNSVVVWKFYEDSVERAGYFFDGNGIHDSEKSTADYKIQKDVIKVEFDDEEILIPYTFAEGKIVLEEGKYFSDEDIEREIQGYWNLRHNDYILGMRTSNEYNVQFDNGKMIIENAADAFNGAPGEYYYYGPFEGTYTIGDGKFETNATHGGEYFFNVYEGKVNIFHYGNKMHRGEGLPGQNGYRFD